MLFIISTYSFMWWNEICITKIGPINIWRILFSVELGQSQRKSNLSSTDHLVINLEFLKILNSVTKPERTFSFCISEWESDFGSYWITLEVCKKTAHILVKNSSKYKCKFRDMMIIIKFWLECFYKIWSQVATVLVLLIYLQLTTWCLMWNF